MPRSGRGKGEENKRRMSVSAENVDVCNHIAGNMVCNMVCIKTNEQNAMLYFQPHKGRSMNGFELRQVLLFFLPRAHTLAIFFFNVLFD